MDREKNRRKNYFIKRDFQGRFILRFCGLVILGSVISGVILILFSQGSVTTAFVNSRLSIVSTADYILPCLVGSSLITIGLISIATAVVVMYLSHRIAGPLFRIERSARQIGAGDLTLNIKLRSTDEMKKLADCFNEMTGNLNQGLSKIKAQSGNLDSAIDNLKAVSEDKSFSPKQLEDALKTLSEKKKTLDSEIDYFKV